MCAQVHSHKNKYEKLSLHCEPFAYTLNGWKQQKQQHKFHLRLLPPITAARARDQSATRLPPLSFSLFLQLPHFVTVDEIYIFHFVFVWSFVVAVEVARLRVAAAVVAAVVCAGAGASLTPWYTENINVTLHQQRQCQYYYCSQRAKICPKSPNNFLRCFMTFLRAADFTPLMHVTDRHHNALTYIHPRATLNPIL